MQTLTIAYRNRLEQTKLEQTRYLMGQLTWSERFNAIIGARGAGKTTLMLQRIKQGLNPSEAFYLSLDDLYFATHGLADTVFLLRQEGVTHFFIDEVHKYPRNTWAQELKNIHDSYPELRVVFSGSSILNIYKGNADLSRRVVYNELFGLSFREFLAFEGAGAFRAVTLDDLLAHHQDIVTDVTKAAKVVPLFRKYLRCGFYPYYKEGENSYLQKLGNTVNAILETDLPAVEGIEIATVRKLKKLLAVIAGLAPFTPNMTRLGGQVEISRTGLYRSLDLLERARLIGLLGAPGRNADSLARPEKIYLDNTNLAYALGNENVNTGNLRETFFHNQLRIAHTVSCSTRGDFLVDDRFVFEVGGPGKDFSQIAGLPDSYLAVDEIEIGWGSRIPLWLFGFLY